MILEDAQIIEMYWARTEDALLETQNKYGRYCHSIAYNILHDTEDSEECVNDTFLSAWNSMPPHRPQKLSFFLGKITRNHALNRYEMYHAQKRGAGQAELVFDEISECIPNSEDGAEPTDEIFFKEVLNRFLRSLPEETMIIFLRRYWFFCSVKDIADSLALSESKVKVTLMRTRDKFRAFLEKEGVTV